jgi:hypothetical protein
MVPLRIVLAVLGIVFGILWATIGIGWAAVVVLCSLAGLYLGAAIEGGADLSTLLEPLRRTRTR